MLVSSVVYSLILVLVASTCEPYGLRLHYADVLVDSASTHKALLYFNTPSLCENSFVDLTVGSTKHTISCTATAVQTSANMSFYVAYVHTCPLDEIVYGVDFTYAAYGLEANGVPSPHANQEVEARIWDPRSSDESINLIVLADWAKINTNPLNLIDIMPSLQAEIKSRGIDALLIAGDIAYDLHSNQGKNYEDFLKMFEQVSSYIPSILCPGNHEHRMDDDLLLLASSFNVYQVDSELAAGLNLGNLFLIPFDPFKEVYGVQHTKSSYEALKAKLIEGNSSGRFIVPFSHYAMICSGETDQCKYNFNQIKNYFDTMVEYGVSLYLGAHTHSYERTYPYKNGEFIVSQGPYTTKDNQLISIVDGVAGSDTSIITEIDNPQPYTARYTIKESGFGVLLSRKNYLNYAHYSTKSAAYVDVMTIYKDSTAMEGKSNLKTE